MLSSPNSSFSKPQQFRNQAIEEIITSEKSYLKQLEVLTDFFVNPLKNIIETSTHTVLFGHIEMIYNLNVQLLQELESDNNNVAKAFMKLAPFLKLYSVYAFDYKHALLTLQVSLQISHIPLIFANFIFFF